MGEVYYFKKTLEHLRGANLFNYQEINWVYIRHVQTSVNSLGKQHNDVSHLHRRATSDEMKFIRRCEQVACQHVGLGADDHMGKYYGAKSKDFLKKLKELLLEQSILFCYKAYEIYSTDKDIQRCYQLLSSFEFRQKEDLIVRLNSLFQQNIMLNAQRRISKNPIKRNLFSDEDKQKFLYDYEKIAKLTLSYDSGLLYTPHMLDTIQEEDVNSVISNKLSISLNGKSAKIKIDNNKI